MIDKANFIVKEGEIPWWELSQGKARKRAYCTQYTRVWRKGRRDLTHVRTSKTPKGVELLYAPYKREPVNACELCGTPAKAQALGWHHWIYENPSVGLWVCPWCNQFAEAVDAGGLELVDKYILLKRQLDERYANGEIVKGARLAKQNRRMCVKIDGFVITVRAYGKRNVPEDNLCELCSRKKSSSYHHWDDSIFGKGIWVCMYDHALAERLDVYGVSFADKYLALKARDGQRLSNILLQQTADSLYILPKQPSFVEISCTAVKESVF